MTQAQFAAYLEHVFRHHNKVMNDLINASSELPEDGDFLSSAEEHMAHACEPLNEVVSAEATSQATSYWTRQRLPDAVPECEAATVHLEILLREAFQTKRKLDLNEFHGTTPD